MAPFTAKLPDPAFHLTHSQKTKMQACLKKCKKDHKGPKCKWECFHDLFDQTLSEVPDPLDETLPTDEMDPFTAKLPDPAFHLTHAQKTKMQACLKKCKKDDKGLPVKECKWECYHDLFSDQTLSQQPDPLAETLPTDAVAPFTAEFPDPAFHLTHAQKTKMQACLKKCKK